MTTGEKIKARREELGMTTEELGRLIGVQRSAVTKYEKGKIDLKNERLKQIAKALLIPAFELLSDDPDEVQSVENDLTREIVDLVSNLTMDQKRQALNVLNAMFSDHFDPMV
jgi:repressor LexA